MDRAFSMKINPARRVVALELDRTMVSLIGRILVKSTKGKDSAIIKCVRAMGHQMVRSGEFLYGTSDDCEVVIDETQLWEEFFND